MTINPLIPYLPAFLSFFIYGVVAGSLFRYGKRGGRGCLFPLVFWYGFAILSVFLALLVSVQDTTNQVSFAIGVLVPFTRTILASEAVQTPLHFARSVLEFTGDTVWHIRRLWNNWKAWRETKSNPKQAHGHQDQTNQTNAHDQARQRDQDRQEAERAREQHAREAEARERRQQAERERTARQKQNEQKPPDPDDAPRDPEAVLGLKKPWTPEDLRTAYKREAGRTHPDKWIGKPEAIRQMMEAEYKAIQEAYRILNR